MEHITKYIDQGINIFLFCMAIVILFNCYSNYNNILITVKENQNEDIIYEQNNESEESSVSRGEIITMLFGQMEYDIEIDGVLISKIDDTKENIATFNINHEEYLKSYVYDNKNNVTRIVFTGL
jgi:hypothetical protein